MVQKPSSITRETFRAGAQIFREGEPGSCAYIIERGSVTVSMLKQGRPLVVGTLSTGDIFGEMALVDDSTRSATVTAVEDTEVISVTRDYVKRRLTRADKLTRLFLQVILDKYRSTRTQLITDDLNPATVRHTKVRARDQVIGKIKLEHELQQALEQHELRLRFQPIIKLGDQTLAGFEALSRWEHPQRGLISPQEYLGMAEESGLIVAVGEDVVCQSCDAYRTFEALAGPSQFMCINVSTRQISTPDFADKFVDMIKECGVDPANIRMEITESALMEDPDSAKRTLGRITDAGIRLAIDDFGTGFSSFSYLTRFPIDTLKIDRTFVANMLENGQSMEIVRALVGLAHNLNMEVIGEGVETEQQAVFLSALGCDYAQGYHFARPLTESDAQKLVREYLFTEPIASESK